MSDTIGNIRNLKSLKEYEGVSNGIHNGKAKSISPAKKPLTANGVALVPVVNTDVNYQITNAISLFSDNGYSPVRPGNVSRAGKAVRVNSILSKPERKLSANVSSNTTKTRFFMRGASPYGFVQEAKEIRRRLNSENNTSKRKSMGSAAGYAQPSKHIRITCSLIEADKNSGAPTLTPTQVANLYLAKCEDLRLEKFANQEVRFQEYCRRACVNGRVILRELGLGLSSAQTIANFVKASKWISCIDIRKNSIGDAGVAEIAQALKYSLSVVHVDFSSNEIGSKGGSKIFKALAVNESITSADLSSHEGLHRNHISIKGMRRIVPVLKSNKILAILNIGGNAIKAEGLGYIAEGIAGNYTLASLKIHQNEIQGNSATLKYIKTILIESKVKELDLSENPLGNTCMEGIASILGSSATVLKKLYCANVGINANSVQTIFQEIKRNGSLQTLKLDRNNFSGPQFIEHVAALVGPESPLHHILLNECGLGEDGGKALFCAVCRNSRLKSVSLQKNAIGDASCKALEEALKDPLDIGTADIANGISKSNTIGFLNLNSNSITNDGGKALLEAVKISSIIEKLSLKFNNVGPKFISEIDAKTSFNSSELKRKKVPQYQQEINSIVVDQDLVDELEWKVEQLRQQRAAVENEISLQSQMLEQIRLEEGKKYEYLKREYDKVMEEGKVIDKKMEEFEIVSNEILKRSESCILEVNHRIEAVDSSIERVEHNCMHF